MQERIRPGARKVTPDSSPAWQLGEEWPEDCELTLCRAWSLNQ